MKIFLDPGHGGTDCGNIGRNGLSEKEVVLKVALKLGKILSSRGHSVLFSRVTDTSLKPDKNSDLAMRAIIANNSGSDYFLSIHCNGTRDTLACGTETFYYKQNSQALAERIQNNVVDNSGLKNQGVRSARFYLLKRTVMPSVLIKLAFISNPRDEGLLSEDIFLDKIALFIANSF